MKGYSSLVTGIIIIFSVATVAGVVLYKTPMKFSMSTTTTSLAVTSSTTTTAETSTTSSTTTTIQDQEIPTDESSTTIETTTTLAAPTLPVVCEENETKNYICPDGTPIFWCVCKNEIWICVNSPESICEALTTTTSSTAPFPTTGPTTTVPLTTTTASENY